jgi:hypothetical protein
MKMSAPVLPMPDGLYARLSALRPDDVVEPLDDSFSFAFRKIALLSSDWGTYGYGAMPGATLFRVERRLS